MAWNWAFLNRNLQVSYKLINLDEAFLTHEMQHFLRQVGAAHLQPSKIIYF